MAEKWAVEVGAITAARSTQAHLKAYMRLLHGRQQGVHQRPQKIIDHVSISNVGVLECAFA